MNGYQGYVFHGMRVARLQLADTLRGDIARALAFRAMAKYKTKPIADALIGEALSGEPVDMEVVRRALDRKFRNEANPGPELADFERTCRELREQWAALNRREALEDTGGTWKSLWVLLAAPAAVAAAFWIAGLSAMATGEAGLVSALLAAGWIWASLEKTKPNGPDVRLWREMAAPCAEALKRYVDSREAQWREAVEQELAIPDERAFHEVHATRIAIGGRRVAEILAEGERFEITEFASADPAKAAGGLIEAAQERVAAPELADVLKKLWRNGFRAELERKFAELRDLGWAVVREKPGIRIDRTLCPRVVTIGLPEGPDDPASPILREQFPGAAVVRAFEPDAVEVMVDVHNLALEHLLTHELTAEAYEAGMGSDRRLWHMPRRLRARAEVELAPVGD